MTKASKAGSALTPLQVLQQFRHVVRVAHRHSMQIERATGLPGAQLWLLQEVVDSPGIKMGELAERMHLHPSTVSNLVEKLNTAGWVSKARSGTDQRVVRLHASDAAQSVLSAAPQPTRGLLPDVLNTLSPDELAEVHRGLQVLVDRLAPAEGEAMQPLPFTE